jgi:hypothetical protein
MSATTMSMRQIPKRPYYLRSRDNAWAIRCRPLSCRSPQPELLARHRTEAGKIDKAASSLKQSGTGGRWHARHWSKHSLRSRPYPPLPHSVASKSGFRFVDAGVKVPFENSPVDRVARPQGRPRDGRRIETQFRSATKRAAMGRERPKPLRAPKPQKAPVVGFAFADSYNT